MTYRRGMPERTVEVCTICGRELTHDDHKVSEYAEGWAHDECVSDGLPISLTDIGNLEFRLPESARDPLSELIGGSHAQPVGDVDKFLYGSESRRDLGWRCGGDL